MAMATDKENQSEEQSNINNLENGMKGAIPKIPKEDMLDLEKGAAAMDNLKRSTQQFRRNPDFSAGSGVFQD